MIRTLVIALVLASSALALAQPAVTPTVMTPAQALRDANDALIAGDWVKAESLAAPLVRGADVDGADRAEAYRVVGLASFFQHRLDRAEAAFLAYLKLDLDARLDPALTPPEAITFFEDVRARHAATLRALRPKPRRSRILNLIPPAGQFQNGQRTKGWILLSLEVGLAAVNLGTYAMLKNWCNPDDLVCADTGGDHTRAAHRMQTINHVAGYALIGVYVYGVIDGFLGSRHRSMEQMPLSVTPTDDGALMVWSSRF